VRTLHAVGFGLVLLAVGTSTSLAQNAGGINYVELFQQLDANGDMVIDRGEVPDSGRAAFDQLLKNADDNKDGKIDREEYRDMLASLRESFGSVASRFGDMDKDGDGKLSKDEFRGPEPLFAQIDADGDGVITKDEAAKFQPGAGAGAGMIARRVLGMDKDRDGKVSRDEFTGPPANFDRLDANKDGFITRNELPGAAAAGVGAPDRAMLRERLQAMDKDGDGKVSKDEFTGEPALFDRLDTNKDGVISREDNPDAAPGRPPGGNPATGGAARAERLRAMDKNHDGKISKDEFTGPAELFDRLDANSDGVISTDELPGGSPEPGKAKSARGRARSNKV